MWNNTSSDTPVLNNFLDSIGGLVQSRDGVKLQDFLQLEPPLSAIYNQMTTELQRAYPADGGKDAELLSRCEKQMSGGQLGSPWPAFAPFMRLYLTFLRDVNVDNLLETYNMLKALLNQSVIALGDSQMGIVILPTVFYLSKLLSKLAIGLDRQPELIAHLLRDEGGESGQSGTGEKVTLVEKSTNIVREAFIKCLTDRSGTSGTHAKPEGKRAGIYLMANLCLKLLFKCGKLRNAEQMFASINSQSPPLEYFPASQRVTYLYYLGRYLFSNNLFYPAMIVLEAAYNQCHRQALKHRSLILTYLIPCNIILGRFPSQKLLQRSEAEGLGDRFIPLCRYIAKGEIHFFRNYLSVSSPHAEWFAKKGLLLPLRNRCEILVWRSLTRKVFILAGFHGDQKMQAQRGPPPFLYLQKLEAAVRWLDSRTPPYSHRLPTSSQQDQVDLQITSFPSDPDFLPSPEPADDSIFDDYNNPEWYFGHSGQHVNVNGSNDLPIDGLAEDLTRISDPYSTLITEDGDNHPQPTVNGNKGVELAASPLMQELENVLASLLTQDLMRGYLTHKNPRYAIPGARLKGALPTGFPNVWQTIYAREREDEQIPGWVKPLASGGARGASAMLLGGGSRVINLSGARSISEMMGSS
ncbi:COP9 signalosome complex subunit 12 [Nannizzia gypsea CBS 118893]|uniref:COP9 signalosome complex subunit 12 n=1 Tax=Arthroderma gypseum (strain ATCC MYA-4604 / CBS 118893) TaxID=535722 RepID=E4URW3_ARTGP|nr:COP9 signalosome complex subunit 12 [Nannizzia gypsea CBS 118893]EFR00434.1 COP9 signalosome complex subunit 12 [Nannizzia gypsea CBS 118893]